MCGRFCIFTSSFITTLLLPLAQTFGRQEHLVNLEHWKHQSSRVAEHQETQGLWASERPGRALGVRSDKKMPKYLDEKAPPTLSCPGKNRLVQIFVCFLWSCYLYCGVDSESKDAKKKSVEHTEDWGPAVVWRLLGTCKTCFFMIRLSWQKCWYVEVAW